MTYTCNKLINRHNKFNIMVCGRYGLWPIWIFCVANMVFCCGWYCLSVADIVCGRYGRTQWLQTEHKTREANAVMKRRLSRTNSRHQISWWILCMGGLNAHAQDMLQPLAEWFYATEYISLVSLAFADQRIRIVVVFSNQCTHFSVSLLTTPLRLPDYRN